MSIAYQGIEGAFSHEACLRFVPDQEPVPLATFADVVAAVQSGDADFGMLPLANNEAGETGARDLIERVGLHIVEEAVLPVRMHLLGLPGTTLDQVRTVVSHPIALSQCSEVLRQLDVKIEETSNTALAAQALRNPGRAVLASESAARIHGLVILKQDVHNRADNATTFAVVSRGDA